MDNGTTSNGKIEALRKREAALKAAIVAEQVRQQKRKEKEDARLASIIGAALIDNCAKQESLGVMVKQILAASDLRESDRAFLAGKGWR
jgi:hypothetical protein